MKFSVALGWVASRVLLSVFYALVVTPIGLFVRLSKKDTFDLTFPSPHPSDWTDHAERTADNYERQF